MLQVWGLRVPFRRTQRGSVPQPVQDAAPPLSPSGKLRHRILRRPYRIRLQTRFMLYFTTLIVAIMTLVVVIVEKRSGETIVKQAEKRGLSIARNLAAVSQPSLVTYNYVALTQNAERAKREEEGIAEVIILNKEGRVAAYSQHSDRQGTVLNDPVSERAAAARGELVAPVELPREDRPGLVERGLDIAVPVYIENSQEKWGTVRIRLSTEDMSRQIRDTRLTLLAVGLGAIALGTLGSLFMARRITGPVSKLVDGTIQAAGGDLETRIVIRTGDEIEELARNFNDMIRQIEAKEKAVEHRSHELHSLHEVGLALASASDTERALALAADAARSISGAQACAVVAQVGQRRASWGGAAADPLDPEARRGIEASLARLRAAGRVASPEAAPAGVGSVSIRHARALFGWILLVEAPDLSRDTLELLEILAGQAAASLSNIQLLEERLESERLSTIGRMISTIVHDFRNPMTAIKGYSGMFQEFELPPERQREYAGLIIEEVDRMTAMIDEILEFSRGERAPLHLSRITVEDLAAKVRHLVEPEFEGKGVAFATRLGYAGPVVADVDRLKRAILNIASNALDAMELGGTFTLESRLNDGRVELSFADTGRGIPEELQPRIFEPFFTHGKPKGIGLGMSITRKIVEDHGGEIQLESRPGEGTRFTLRLPLEPATDPPEATGGPGSDSKPPLA